MTNGLLWCDKMIGQFVEILQKSKITDPETGREMNHGRTAFFRGCDGLFLYYSFDSGDKAEYTGFIPVSDVLDVIRVDHLEEMMQDEE